MELFLLFAVFIPPLISFTVNGLVLPVRRNRVWSSGISIGSVFISTLASLLLLLERAKLEFVFEWIPAKIFPPVHFGFFLDPIAVIMLFVVSVVALMVQIYSLGYMSEEEPLSFGRYYTFHSLFAFSMQGFVISYSLLQIYVFWELVGLCSYLLIGFWYQRPQAARAAVKAFWITRFGDVGFAIGMILIWGATGTFLLPELYSKASEVSKVYLLVSLLLVFWGAVGKSAQFPLHVWLPDAMEGPTPVSALIHAATMVVAGVYLVIRLFPVFELVYPVLPVIMWIGCITAFIGAAIALVQDDIKRVLAYSTVSQIGYMMAVAGAGEASLGFFHLFTHAFFKSLLFLAAGSVIHTLHTNNIWEMGGLSKRMPQTSLLFLVGALALSGIFPFSGYFSKDEILIWMYHGEFKIPFIILVFTAFLTAFYMFRVLFVAFFGKRDVGKKPEESPLIMTLPMWVLGVFAIASGFLKVWFFDFIGDTQKEFHHTSYVPYISLGLSLFGILCAWLVYEKGFLKNLFVEERALSVRYVLERGFWIDSLYEWLYRRVLDGLSFICGWFDRYIVDGLVNLVSWVTLGVSQYLRGIQTGRIQDYLYGIVVAIVLFIWLAFGVL